MHALLLKLMFDKYQKNFPQKERNPMILQSGLHKSLTNSKHNPSGPNSDSKLWNVGPVGVCVRVRVSRCNLFSFLWSLKSIPYPHLFFFYSTFFIQTHLNLSKSINFTVKKMGMITGVKQNEVLKPTKGPHLITHSPPLLLKQQKLWMASKKQIKTCFRKKQNLPRLP